MCLFLSLVCAYIIALHSSEAQCSVQDADPDLSGHYSRDWSEHVKVNGVISEQCPTHIILAQRVLEGIQTWEEKFFGIPFPA